jgi:tyrosine-specific transport protein
MVHQKSTFLRSVGMMIGAIIGVGVFGLPYAFAQSGFVLGLLELFFLGAILVILQLMLGEVVVQTPGRHRLVSYIQMYLGERWKWVTLIALSLGIWGAMLAYLVVGGTFLHLLLSPIFGGEPALYSYALALLASVLIFGGLAFASRIEYLVVGALLFLFTFIILASIPQINVAHYASMNLDAAFVPYGVILFSLAGMGIVPELKDVLGKKHQRYMAPVILVGMGVILLLYALFAFAVVGVTGADTSTMAFDGLIPHLGQTVRVVGTLLGSITILSIYMVLGVELLNTFKFDFNFRHRTAWVLVCAMPLILFALGLREFIHIIGFVGSVFGGLLGILVALSYWSLRRKGLCNPHHCINFPVPLTWLIIVVFSGGVILEIYSTLIH